MTIQQFADQLKRKNDLSPLLQRLQDLRRCSLDQLQPQAPFRDGWFPWDEKGNAPGSTTFN